MRAHTLEDAPVGYVVADDLGVIRRVNRTLLSWTNSNAAELVGVRRLRELLTAECQVYFDTHVTPLLALQEVVNDVALTFVAAGAEPIHVIGTAQRRDSAVGSTEIAFFLVNTSVRQVFGDESRRVRLRLERLQRFAAALAVAVGVNDIATITLTEILDGVKGDHGYVAMIANDVLRILKSEALARPAGPADGSSPLVEDPDTADVLRAGEPLFLEPSADGGHTPRFRRVDGRATTRLAILPLVTSGRTLGILVVASATKTSFDADERAFLALYAELAAQSLQVAKLHDATTVRAHQAGFIAQLSNALDDALSFQARCQRLVDLTVPELADYATVEVPTDEPRVVALAHRNPDLVEKLRELRNSVRVSVGQPHSLALARATREPQIVADIPEAMYDLYGLVARQRSLLGELAPRSYVGMPMLARGKLVGTLMLVMSESDRHFGPEDLPHLTDIANRAAVSLENARLYDHERWVARSLQTELLSRPLPEDDRLQLRVEYRAGGDLVEIGGDYFDAFFVTPDRIALAVGDVVGRGIPAATIMGQLRTALRAFALQGHGPAETLDRLELFATSIPGSDYSTVVYAELHLRTGELVYSCAGHPPPVLLTERSGASALWDGRSPVLGISGAGPRSEGRLQMTVGSTIFLYTDGLVEAHTRSLDAGIAEMIEVLDGDRFIDLDSLVAKLNVSDDVQDDTCVLALTIRAMG